MNRHTNKPIPDFTDYIEWDGGRKLPTYKGYIVDVRLCEFRKINNPHEALSFDSDEGDVLLSELIEQLPRTHKLFKEIAATM